jgi:hypothetical protein
LNDPEGSLELLDVPLVYRPGERYEIRVVLARPGLPRGGFQLTARFAGGEDVGGQAGTLAGMSERVQVQVDDSTGIQYAEHTEPGTWGEDPGTVGWVVVWRSPDTLPEKVTFHVAANASNDDGSPFGDFIYTMDSDTKPRLERPEPVGEFQSEGLRGRECMGVRGS